LTVKHHSTLNENVCNIKYSISDEKDTKKTEKQQIGAKAIAQATNMSRQNTS